MSGWPDGSRFDNYFRTLASNEPLAERLGMTHKISKGELVPTFRAAVKIFLLDQESTGGKYDSDSDLIRHFRNWFTSYHEIYLQPKPGNSHANAQFPAQSKSTTRTGSSAGSASNLRPNGFEPRNGRKFGKL